MHDPHPVRLVVEDDYRRNRLTVFFRLLLAIPHFIWFFLWTVWIVITSFVNWLMSIFTGRPRPWFHRLMCGYVRYQAHLGAYLSLVADPYPGFMGEAGQYPIDIQLPEEPVAQRRWTILIRLVLFIPALLLASTLGGFTGGNLGSSRGKTKNGNGGGTLLLACAFLGWFASLARGQMPKGLRDAGAYAIGYTAQASSYLLLVTDRYPNADPTEMLVAVIAAIVQWFITLVRGTPARALHRFISAYIRYRLHVTAFLMLVANPFPGFTGAPGVYPLDLELDGPQRQNRWKTGFRLLLAIPAFIVDAVLGGSLLFAAVLTWFYALVKGSAPWGLRNLSAYALRYDAQTNAYLFLVTDAYPHASPLEGEDTTEA